MPRDLRQCRQTSGLFETSPTLAEDENGHDANPVRFHPECEANEAESARNTDDSRNGQAMCPAKGKPKERPQNLPAIQRIDREQVENEEPDVDVP